MTLKRFKPTSPGIRGKIMVNRSHLYRGKPLRFLSTRLRLTGGRNNLGRLTSRRKGGGVKRRYRIINFKSDFTSGVVERLEYDPNRSAWISLVRDDSDRLNYIIAAEGMVKGQRLEYGVKGRNNRIQLSSLKEGETGFGLSKDHFGKAMYGRSAGTSLRLISWEGDRALVKLPSGELKLFPKNSWITQGTCSNIDHRKEKMSKAGTAVRLNRRPIVRGMAQSAHDHPMGSKTGKSKGHHPKTRWGKLAKGVRTRSKSKLSNKIIVRRRYEQK